MIAARILPHFMRAPLFGDRDQYGLVPDEEDAHWQEWQAEYLRFYQANQKEGVGKTVNDAGYAILKAIDWSDSCVVEIGPGRIPHLPFWDNAPKQYYAVDISDTFLSATQERLAQAYPDCPFIPLKQSQRCGQIDLPDNSVDFIVTFYSLEHLNPLADFLDDYARILKPGGMIVGAVPNEGGLAWGLGRYMTSRRWIRKNTTINYDKIICWEHPNFVDDIMQGLEERFRRVKKNQYPMSLIPLYDSNLVTRFMYQKDPS